MAQSRRSFLTTTGILTTGSVLLFDPFIRSCQRLSEKTLEEFAGQFTYFFDLVRPADFLAQRYYFINLTLNGRQLQKIKPDEDAYMIVKLPQQHIGEQVQQQPNPAGNDQPRKPWEFEAGTCRVVFPPERSDHYSQSFVAGYSYLSFVLKKDTKVIRLNKNEHLDWNRFDLLTVNELKKSSTIPVKLSTESISNQKYPITEKAIPGSLVIASINGMEVPVTLLEVPFKMFLSPVQPIHRSDRDTDYRFQFARNNDLFSYYKIENGSVRQTLSELWNNYLLFRTSSKEKGVSDAPPTFKILAYEELTQKERNDARTSLPPDYKQPMLLPNPLDSHRSNLAKLSNFDGEGRDIQSTHFNVSSLGATTYLNYFNLDERQFVIVGWKQDIKLGRDNYVEITDKGIDTRTSLKLLISEISERRIEGGKSFLIRRQYFKYLEKEKEFNEPLIINNYPFVKIKAQDEGSFFTYIKGTAPGGFGDDDGFIPLHECDKTVLKMSYLGIDKSGREIPLNLDLMVIRKWKKGSTGEERSRPISQLAFTKTKVEEYLKAFNARLVTRLDSGDHLVKLDRQKIAFTQGGNETAGVQVKNNELVTEELQFYSSYNPAIVPEDSSAYESEYPLLPHLMYAAAYIPQLQAIETVPQLHLVAFSKNHRNNGLDENANKAKTFLRTLSEDIKIKPLLQIDEDAVFDEIGSRARAISNVFAANYKNAGSLINPGISIENISLLDPALVLTDKISEIYNNIDNISPVDILRGLDAELLGGIDLKMILKKLIPFVDAPIFQILEQAEEGYQKLDAYRKEYEDLKGKITDGLNDIKGIEGKLKGQLNNEVKTYLDKFYEKKGELKTVMLRQILLSGTLSDFEKRRSDFLKLQTELTRLLVAHPDWTSYGMVRAEIQTFLSGKVDDIKSILSLQQVLATCDKRIEELNRQSEQLMVDYLYYINGSSNQLISSSRLHELNTASDQLKSLIQLRNYLKAAIEDGMLFRGWSTNIVAGYSTLVKRLTDAGYLDLLSKEPGLVQGFFYEKFNELFLEATAKFKELPADLLNVTIDKKPFADFLKTVPADLLNIVGIQKSDGKFIKVLNDDLSGIQAVWTERGEELRKLSVDLFDLQLRNIQEIGDGSKTRLVRQQLAMEGELNVLITKINEKVRDEVNAKLRQINGAAVIQDLKTIHDVYQSSYLIMWDWNKRLERLKKAVSPDNQDLVKSLDDFKKDIEVNVQNSVKVALIGELQALKNDSVVSSITLLPQQIDDFCANLKAIGLAETDQYNQAYAKINTQIDQTLGRLYLTVDSEREKLLQQLVEKKAALRVWEGQLKDFLATKLKKMQDDLKLANLELVKAYQQGRDDVEQLQARVNKLNEALQTLQSIDKKETRYVWKTSEFQDINLGILSFITGRRTRTELAVNVKNTIHFDLGYPPRIKDIQTSTDSSLSNFTLNFLGLLSVEFDKVSFASGPGTQNKFDVQIRDVRFDGPLNFVQVFQKYLKTIDKGLRFDISVDGAVLGYELNLPDISGGAFNFAKVKLLMDLRLPFRAGVPMRLVFGLNSPQDMFLLTATIFGGRGCFQLAVEPKRGVVMILLIIEFGGILYLNIGVAEGIVFLLAGIYIRKEYDRVLLKGYLTCGGRLDVLGLISVSVTFYLGLQGNGNYMEGYCTVYVRIRICAFVKITVGLSMYKRIYGSPDNSSRLDAPVETFAGLPLTAQQKIDLNVVADSNNGMDIAPNKINEEDWDEYFKGNYHKI